LELLDMKIRFGMDIIGMDVITPNLFTP